MAVWGYVTAVLIPIVGAVIGARLVKRGDDRGKKVLLVAAAMFALFFVVTLADSSSAFTGLD
jgi:uncharacterized membrane protein YozB (DUF420 family)